ncbi:uncharacterized protein L201_007435 [Kwoniella dendrophila CBS 6074]|uniref:Uncharacterized protein n=1 Tax=Kwoniella dendrophila CBS 6074 TaxID=1295534 RepID=A0AAX4K4D7_9TREE
MINTSRLAFYEDIPSHVMTHDQMEKNDMKTAIEIYGLEKLLSIGILTFGIARRMMRESLKDLEENGKGIIRDIEKASEEEAEEGEANIYSCWYNYSNSKISKNSLREKQEIQRKELIGVQEDILKSLGINEDGKWFRRINGIGKWIKAPTVNVHLSVDYLGCSACDDGKHDSWPTRQIQLKNLRSGNDIPSDEFFDWTTYFAVQEQMFDGVRRTGRFDLDPDLDLILG